MKFANNSLTVLEDGTETDLMPKELEIIKEFKEKGLPGVTSLSDLTLAKCIDLYLSGKTYHEIGKILSVRKEIVLYLGQKFNWYATKVEHMQMLDATLKERILHAKLMNQDFVLQIQHFFSKKIGNKMSRFMATGDEDIASKVDRKDIEMYFKAVELLEKISTEKVPVNAKGPAVGLNLGEHGITVKKVGEDEVLITPRNKTVAEMLNELANMKRQEDDQNKKTNDIDSKDSKENKTKGSEENDE